MAIQYFTKNDQSNTSKGEVIWEATQALSSGTNGNSLVLPDETGKVESIMVSLVISSGEGKIQTTVSPLVNVEAGTANWIDWDRGAVSTTTADVFYNVTAIRAVRVSGTIKLEARAV
jgi:hypothetical protein